MDPSLLEYHKPNAHSDNFKELTNANPTFSVLKKIPVQYINRYAQSHRFEVYKY